LKYGSTPGGAIVAGSLNGQSGNFRFRKIPLMNFSTRRTAFEI